MKWMQITDQTSAVQVFHLLEGNAVKEVLRYNPLQNSTRVSCMGKQRLFFIEQIGFSGNRFYFKNEYGFTIGKLFIEDHNAEGGTIEIEEKKLHYRINKTPSEQLSIYEHNSMQPLVTCNLSKKNSNSKQIISLNESVKERASFLLGLCWYMFNPQLQQNEAISSPVLAFA